VLSAWRLVDRTMRCSTRSGSCSNGRGKITGNGFIASSRRQRLPARRFVLPGQKIGRDSMRSRFRPGIHRSSRRRKASAHREPCAIAVVGVAGQDRRHLIGRIAAAAIAHDGSGAWPSVNLALRIDRRQYFAERGIEGGAQGFGRRAGYFLDHRLIAKRPFRLATDDNRNSHRAEIELRLRRTRQASGRGPAQQPASLPNVPRTACVGFRSAIQQWKLGRLGAKAESGLGPCPWR
jgi:hypothetical protein